MCIKGLECCQYKTQKYLIFLLYSFSLLLTWHQIFFSFLGNMTSNLDHGKTSMEVLHHVLSIKLMPTNYLLWTNQFEPIINCYNLGDFTDPLFDPPPPPAILTIRKKSSPNLECISWFKKVRLLQSWILSSFGWSNDSHNWLENISQNLARYSHSLWDSPLISPCSTEYAATKSQSRMILPSKSRWFWWTRSYW